MLKKRVIMIDNDPFSLAVLHRLLSEMGYEPLIGSTPDAANALLAGKLPDAIVYNQDLDAEWGIALLDRLRRTPRTEAVPVILLTQTTRRFESRIEGTDDSMVRFRKPIAIEPFVALFRSLVEGRPDPLRLAGHFGFPESDRMS